jgi:hypothetical protein
VLVWVFGGRDVEDGYNLPVSGVQWASSSALEVGAAAAFVASSMAMVVVVL